MAWTSAPTTTVTGGAPCRPSSSTFQPARASTAWRAAASAVKFAIVAPATNAPALSGGSRSASSVQASAAASIAAAAGDITCSAQFWSQAVASQFDATVTGSEPPLTKPK